MSPHKLHINIDQLPHREDDQLYPTDATLEACKEAVRIDVQSEKIRELCDITYRVIIGLIPDDVLPLRVACQTRDVFSHLQPLEIRASPHQKEGQPLTEFVVKLSEPKLSPEEADQYVELANILYEIERAIGQDPLPSQDQEKIMKFWIHEKMEDGKDLPALLHLLRRYQKFLSREEIGKLEKKENMIYSLYDLLGDQPHREEVIRIVNRVMRMRRLMRFGGYAAAANVLIVLLTLLGLKIFKPSDTSDGKSSDSAVAADARTVEVSPDDLLISREMAKSDIESILSILSDPSQRGGVGFSDHSFMITSRFPLTPFQGTAGPLIISSDEGQRRFEDSDIFPPEEIFDSVLPQIRSLLSLVDDHEPECREASLNGHSVKIYLWDFHEREKFLVFFSPWENSLPEIQSIFIKIVGPEISVYLNHQSLGTVHYVISSNASRSSFFYYDGTGIVERILPPSADGEQPPQLTGFATPFPPDLLSLLLRTIPHVLEPYKKFEDLNQPHEVVHMSPLEYPPNVNLAGANLSYGVDSQRLFDPDGRVRVLTRYNHRLDRNRQSPFVYREVPGGAVLQRFFEINGTPYLQAPCWIASRDIEGSADDSLLLSDRFSLSSQRFQMAAAIYLRSPGGRRRDNYSEVEVNVEHPRFGPLRVGVLPPLEGTDFPVKQFIAGFVQADAIQDCFDFLVYAPHRNRLDITFHHRFRGQIHVIVTLDADGRYWLTSYYDGQGMHTTELIFDHAEIPLEPDFGDSPLFRAFLSNPVTTLQRVIALSPWQNRQGAGHFDTESALSVRHDLHRMRILHRKDYLLEHINNPEIRAAIERGQLLLSQNTINRIEEVYRGDRSRRSADLLRLRVGLRSRNQQDESVLVEVIRDEYLDLPFEEVRALIVLDEN